MKFNRRSIFGLAAGAAMAPVVGAPDLRAGIWTPVDANAAGSLALHAGQYNIATDIITYGNFSSGMDMAVRLCGESFSKILPRIYDTEDEE